MSSADETDDVSLINRVMARDAEALGKLYDRHSRLMFGLILRVLRTRDEAEEVLQDAFVQVWNRAETYKAELGTPIQWLVRIARNRAIDRRRANSVRARTLDSVEWTLPSSQGPGPEAHAALSEQQRVLARALEGLRAEERELLESAYFLGFTQSELAERFNLPLGTVKTRIRNALSTLRGSLQQSLAGAPGS
jgi:RNA polymerase sigma-70 factor (ECF subfamily)